MVCVWGGQLPPYGVCMGGSGPHGASGGRWVPQPLRQGVGPIWANARWLGPIRTHVWGGSHMDTHTGMRPYRDPHTSVSPVRSHTAGWDPKPPRVYKCWTV